MILITINKLRRLKCIKNLPQIKQEIIRPKQKPKPQTLSPEHFKQIEKELFGIE